MWTRAKAILLAGLAAGLLAGCGDDPPPDQPTVRVGGAEVRVDVADTAQELTRGLGGREGLDEDEGMLFELPAAARQPFWMKGMRFPIDIIWIAGGRVTDISARVPAPEPGVTDSELPRYRPRQPADRALEVNAGWAAENGVGRGAAVDVGL